MPRWLDSILFVLLALAVLVVFMGYVCACKLGAFVNRAKVWLRQARRDFRFP